MTCTHLQQLYKLCREYDLKLGGSDLIRVVCHQCGAQDVCPSNLMDQCSSDAATTDTENKQQQPPVSTATHQK